MMYFNKFVVSIMVDGKYLREENGNVSMPFGTEYSIYFKNLNTQDAVVKLSIDGKDMFNGSRLVVKAKESAVVHGEVNGLKAKNAFKFIERTERIERHRGISPEDGIVRVEYWFEKKRNAPTITWASTYTPNYDISYPIYVCGTALPTNDVVSNDTMYGGGITYGEHRSHSMGGSVSSSAFMAQNVSQSPPGITVKGSQIDQGFGVANSGIYESVSDVILLTLKGYRNNKEIDKVITTREKIKCPTCGKKNKTKDKFCSECGTGLK